MGSVKNLAILVSGQGSVCNAIHRSTKMGKLAEQAKVNLVISTNHACTPLHGLSRSGYRAAYMYMPWDDPDEWHVRMYELMDWFEIDLICMAGFIKKLHIWPDWENKVLNTHPSLLPKFGGKGMYGDHVHRAVIQSKEEETGCTVHVATNEYDQGRILGQSKFKLREIDREGREYPHVLSNWVKNLEYELYPQVISDYLKEQYPKS